VRELAYSGIGGQAVMEGVMMKYKDTYAVAVRKPDQEIIVEKRNYHGICKNKTLRNLVLVRGIISFVESMVLGLSTLTFSASFFEEDDKGKEAKPRNEKKEKAEMGFTIALSMVLAVAIFMVLPFYASLFFQKYIDSDTLVILIEGILRLLIFFAYILLISRMEDIKRVFMYHGAEHKCINCIEHGLDLTVENVKKSSREHKRCGTSFLFFVVIIAIIATMFIRVDSRLLRILLRIAIIPLIAGVSYEFIRLAGRCDNAVINLLSKPGLWMQKLTTREPDEEMIEVGIASVEAVFDWKSYVKLVRESGRYDI
jgi:Predicted metal-dependent enzyme